MTTTAKIIADSISPFTGDRLTTMQLRYPRFIHAEFMTHRQFSRNASSSRAIPVERLIQDVLDDPAIPTHWGKNQPGMQAREEHDAPVVFRNDQVPAEIAWTRARDVAVDAARRFAKAGYHKQVANRLLEPFAHINVVVTATDWDNFFLLRDHPDADPSIQLLARAMREAMDNSAPAVLDRDFGWHLPYIDLDVDMPAIRDATGVTDTDGLYEYTAKVSAARCARTSYLTHDGRRSTVDEDLPLYSRLVGAKIKHASPLEHQAKPQAGRWANFQGWRSFRNIMEDYWS
ncbi:thimidilate synthase [Caulobacter phage Seuss]|uniref:Thimidilate synthase n=1 Tax=Caulobacter phage Seuss TaxID=1675601 RepID=A0A0K1LN66_9CAUD|nr:thimidilate synthase [Caulobacter phage Seuss]AKU43580.1 thimidilate synthase [Caulobacter phage Seuss]